MIKLLLWNILQFCLFLTGLVKAVHLWTFYRCLFQCYCLRMLLFEAEALTLLASWALCFNINPHKHDFASFTTMFGMYCPRRWALWRWRKQFYACSMKCFLFVFHRTMECFSSCFIDDKLSAVNVFPLSVHDLMHSFTSFFDRIHVPYLSFFVCEIFLS